MFVRVDNTPRDYAWGSESDISQLRGRTPSGRPEAELWLGTHPGSPLVLAEGDRAHQLTLAEFLDEQNQPHLPYLLKLLSAASPLSIQVHPTREQAVAGFSRENALDIALDAPHRNYKDASDKPELIVALRDGFVALCGFQAHDAIRAHLVRLREVLVLAERTHDQIDQFLGELDRRGEEFLAWALEWVLGSGACGALIDEVTVASEKLHDELIVNLAEQYPGDPGVIVALLLHRVTLAQGEALFLPAGNVHAYIRGFGIELMVASDNVLRGGLTPKHIDVPELLAVAHTRAVAVPYLAGRDVGSGLVIYQPEGADLKLARFTPLKHESTATVPLTRIAIGVCTEGAVTLHGAVSELSVEMGDIVAIFADEQGISCSGNGQFFLAC